MVECPCCGYYTLKVRGRFEVCYLCDWEDDGQDDKDADAVRGGPNGDYSLKEARENFKKYYTFFRWDNPLLYFHEFKEVIELKRRIIHLLEINPRHSELNDMKKYWNKIDIKAWKQYGKQKVGA